MKDRVTILIAGTISAFVLIGLVGAFILALRGQDPGQVFPKIFDLMAVLVGAIGGFITGTQIERRNGHAKPEPEPEPEPEPSDELDPVAGDSDHPGDE